MVTTLKNLDFERIYFLKIKRKKGKMELHQLSRIDVLIFIIYNFKCFLHISRLIRIYNLEIISFNFLL